MSATRRRLSGVPATVAGLVVAPAAPTHAFPVTPYPQLALDHVLQTSSFDVDDVASNVTG